MVALLLSRLESYVVLRGSATLAPLIQRVGARYMAENTRIGLPLIGGGSERGYKSILDGTADIGMASGPMPEEMEGWAGRQPVRIRCTTIAYDGIAAIVHPANPLSNITFAQLTDVFEGAISDWSELGGPKRPITVYSQDPLQGTYEAWIRTVAKTAGVITSRAVVVPGDGIAARVGADPCGIGYAAPLLIDPAVVKMLSIDGSFPVAADILTGRYPVRRNLDLLTASAPRAAAAAFVAYCMSQDKGQRLLAEAGVVPVQGA